MISARFARTAATILAIVPGFWGTLPGDRALAQPKQAPQQDVMTVEELQGFYQKFNRDLDVAQAEFGREKFREAQGHFDLVVQETESLIKRIATAIMPRNGSIEISGVTKPLTTVTETELFRQHILEQAQRGKAEAVVLQNVADILAQASDLLSAGKYPDARDTYQKAKDALALNRAQLDDQTFQSFLARAENGRRESIVTFWAKEYRRLQDKYNRTTDDDKMSPEEIRGTIKSVADEIVSEGYTDPLKHPDMPEDARDLFRKLLDVASQYLKSP